jgi:hypothetical protein
VVHQLELARVRGLAIVVVSTVTGSFARSPLFG